YITGRQLPDKAVDLLDTAAARVRIEQDAPPAQIAVLKSEQASLDRELGARRRDIDDAAAKDDGRLGELQARIDAINEEIVALEQKLASEKAAIATLHTAYDELRAADEGHRGAKLAAVEAARKAVTDAAGETPLIHAEVDRDSIAQVIADWTGIPVGKM